MRGIFSFEELKNFTNLVCVLGNFDGLHKGHQRLLQRGKELAHAEVDAKLMVITFAGHPWHVLYPEREVMLLSEAKGKREYLKALGVDVVLELPCTESILSMEPMEYLHQLFAFQNVKHIVVGENYTFGKGGAGSVTTLRQEGERTGVTVDVVPLYKEDGRPISSTRIRQHFLAGEIEEGNALLGRPFGFYDIVRHGDERGRLLGFPTANFWFPPHMVKPKDGVYVNRVRIGEKWYQGVGNIGDNPTFENQRHRLEVHILDFSGDLYGKEVYIEFLTFLRPELAFGSVDELKAQLKEDEQKARTYFMERRHNA